MVTTKAKVETHGSTQTVVMPEGIRFHANEVSVSREPGSGNVVLSEIVPHQNLSWDEIWAALDENPLPDDFLADRDQGVEAERVPI